MHTFVRLVLEAPFKDDYHLGALGGEGGETRSYRESDQKLDQAKSKALEIYFRTFCRKSNTKKLQSRVLLEEMC